MLTIEVPGDEFYDESRNEFIYGKVTVLQLEHSLVSLDKWESKYHKSFLSTKKTEDEMIEYIKCMTITQNVKPEVYRRLTPQLVKKISDYMSDPMTATTFKEKDGPKRSNKIVTSEQIFAQMIELNIPPEYRKWHLNKLLTLIRTLSVMHNPGKKMSKRELYGQNKALNAERRKKLNSKG